MKIAPLKPLEVSFNMRKTSPRRKEYAPNCWNDISEGTYKDYSFLIYENYENGRKGPVMIILRKAGLWIKTKIKYVLDGKRMVLWNYFKEPVKEE